MLPPQCAGVLPNEGVTESSGNSYLSKGFSRHWCLSAKPIKHPMCKQQDYCCALDDCSQAPARLFKIAHFASELTGRRSKFSAIFGVRTVSWRASPIRSEHVVRVLWKLLFGPVSFPARVGIAARHG